MDLIVTVLTKDRPGVIEQVAAVVAEHRGSWQDSRMAQLAGTFAGIIAVAVPDAEVDPLTDRLRAMPDIVVHVAAGSGAVRPVTRHRLLVVANDRPGIVAEVSRELAAQGVNVAELSTAVEPASMSGGVVFRATIDIGLEPGDPLEAVIVGLEGLSDDLMIDVLEV